MKIILMRHGEAIPFAPSDAERMLTPNGRGEATRTAHLLQQGGFVMPPVFCSTHLRARETAELVTTAWQSDSPTAIAGLTPEDDWQAAMAVIEGLVSDAATVVFHQPILAQIVGHLLTGDHRDDIQPRAVPAAAYVLSLEHFAPGSATLIAAYTP